MSSHIIAPQLFLTSRIVVLMCMYVTHSGPDGRAITSTDQPVKIIACEAKK
jgi:hypothetical protein